MNVACAGVVAAILLGTTPARADRRPRPPRTTGDGRQAARPRRGAAKAFVLAATTRRGDLSRPLRAERRPPRRPAQHRPLPAEAAPGRPRHRVIPRVPAPGQAPRRRRAPRGSGLSSRRSNPGGDAAAAGDASAPPAPRAVSISVMKPCTSRRSSAPRRLAWRRYSRNDSIGAVVLVQLLLAAAMLRRYSGRPVALHVEVEIDRQRLVVAAQHERLGGGLAAGLALGGRRRCLGGRGGGSAVPASCPAVAATSASQATVHRCEGGLHQSLMMCSPPVGFCRAAGGGLFQGTVDETSFSSGSR